MFYALTQLLRVSDDWQFRGIWAAILAAIFGGALLAGGALNFVFRLWASRFALHAQPEDDSDYIHVVVRPRADDEILCYVRGFKGAHEAVKAPTLPWTLDWRENTTGNPAIAGSPDSPILFDLASDFTSEGLTLHSLHQRNGTRFLFDEGSRSVTLTIKARSRKFHRSSWIRVRVGPPLAAGEPPQCSLFQIGMIERLGWLLQGRDAMNRSQ